MPATSSAAITFAVCLPVSFFPVLAHFLLIFQCRATCWVPGLERYLGASSPGLCVLLLGLLCSAACPVLCPGN